MLFNNNNLNTLGMRPFDSTSDGHTAYFTLGSNSNRRNGNFNLAKNVFLALAAFAQLVLTVLTIIELLTLLTVYIYPLAAVGVLSVVSPSFKKFVATALDRIYSITMNNIKLIALVMVIVLPITLGVRALLSLGKPAGKVLQNAQGMAFIEAVLSVGFALSATVASVFSSNVNTALAAIGLIAPSNSRESTDSQKAKWQIGGALGAVITAARFFPNLVLGISATSIVAGIGVAIGEFFNAKNNADGMQEHAYAPRQDRATANASIPIAVPVQQDEDQIPIAYPIPAPTTPRRATTNTQSSRRPATEDTFEDTFREPPRRSAPAPRTAATSSSFFGAGQNNREYTETQYGWDGSRTTTHVVEQDGIFGRLPASWTTPSFSSQRAPAPIFVQPIPVVHQVFVPVQVEAPRPSAPASQSSWFYPGTAANNPAPAVTVATPPARQQTVPQTESLPVTYTVDGELNRQKAISLSAMFGW